MIFLGQIFSSRLLHDGITIQALSPFHIGIP